MKRFLSVHTRALFVVLFEMNHIYLSKTVSDLHVYCKLLTEISTINRSLSHLTREMPTWMKNKSNIRPICRAAVWHGHFRSIEPMPWTNTQWPIHINSTASICHVNFAIPAKIDTPKLWPEWMVPITAYLCNEHISIR